MSRLVSLLANGLADHLKNRLEIRLERNALNAIALRCDRLTMCNTRALQVDHVRLSSGLVILGNALRPVLYYHF